MSKRSDRQMEENIAQFCAVTGASTRDAKKYLERHNKRVDLAIDAFFNEPAHTRYSQPSGPSTSKLSQMFDQYKDPDGDDITIDGTIKFCEDLGVDPEDVVLLSVAYELKSPRMGEWTRKGWVDGWKAVGCDSIATMKTALLRLRDRLGSDAAYFRDVYNYAFDFARPPGQRSLGMDMAQGFWALLIPHGLQGGALSHKTEDDDESMGVDEEGWNEEHTDLWFEYLTSKNVRAISKDVWHMFLEFVRTIDARFAKYDAESSWPSTIDDFVEYARQRLASGH